MSKEKSSFKALSDLSLSQLRQEVVLGRKALFHFRCQKKDAEVKPHEIRSVRKRIARLKTALTLKWKEGKKES